MAERMKPVLPSTYKNPVYPYQRCADQDAGAPVRHEVIVVGAGPTGLVAALDLARQGISCVVLSKTNTVSTGSRAICFSKRTLEIIHRVSPEAAARMLAKGVVWKTGKVFYDENLVYSFDLLPEAGHQMPAFINLQQYYFEEYLIDAIRQNPLIDLRWQHALLDLTQTGECVHLEVQTPEGPYALEADYLLACDGVHSRTREALGIPFEGERFEENFLIADITMAGEFPAERWFWFDPPFNRGYSALLHKQPDSVWRIDLQLGRDIDREKEMDPERIKGRLRKMLGDERAFELEWTSIYQFRCMRIPDFVHGRILFAGDSAHLVSPYGARGANGGIQDVDNLVWKLAHVLRDLAPPSLLHTYHEERSPAADENIRHSTQSTDFITPKSPLSLLFRNAALDMAATHDGTKSMINSGRLSNAFKYLDSSLTTPDHEVWGGTVQPGYPVKDAPLLCNGETCWLLDKLGNRFVLVSYTDQKDHPANKLAPYTWVTLENLVISSHPGATGMLIDRDGLFTARYDAQPGSWYLFRPDAHLAARGRQWEPAEIIHALDRALGKPVETRPASVPDKHPDYPNDILYNSLLRAQEGLNRNQIAQLHARLILLLLQKISDPGALLQMLKHAREGLVENNNAVD